MNSTHERVDLERWVAMFPIAALEEAGGDRLTSPNTVAIVEQLRRKLLGGRKWETIPTDVFVFAKGEPIRREVTKVGGLPYWPSGKPWPRREDGRPMPFVGQFNFTDSADLAGKLPGDVLLLFLADDGVRPPIHLEWAIVVEQPLVSPEEMPRTRFEFLPCHGAIHRTVDYSDVAADDELEGKVNQPWNVTVWEGTKIGGIPSGIQEDKGRGKFLCALGSIEPSPSSAWPFLNMAEPFDYDSKEAETLLMWGDAGSLFIHIGADGTVRAEMDGY